MDDFLPDTISHRQALALGFTDRHIRRRLASGTWRRVRRGVYSTEVAPSSREDRHRLAIAAAMPRISDDAVLSHQSAAVMHGMPLWKVPGERVDITRRRSSGGRRSSSIFTHVGPSDDATVTINALPVTSAPRTVVDLARTLTFEEGVVVADAALHRKLVTPDQLQIELTAARGRDGVARARAVCAFADGLSESVGESRSRVLLHRAGLPAPELQAAVHDAAGREVARCDFAYRDLRILGEFDGFVKYSRHVRPGETPGEVAFREKQREDMLRDLGWIVVRWVWDEIGRPGVVVARIRKAMARSAAWC